MRQRDRWRSLATERRNPKGRDLDLLPPEAVARRVLDEDLAAVRAARAHAEELAAVAVWFAETIATGGRVFYVGAGTSGRLGVLDAAELPPTYGLPFNKVRGIIAGGATALRRSIEGAEDRPKEGRAAIRKAKVKRGDLVVGISASSLAPFVRAALEEAERRNARTVLLTMNPPPDASRGGRKRRLADRIVLIPVGRELVRGSTRMKSGTATKVALQAISTTAMVLLGKVWEGEMVDLKPWCAKLDARARRVLCERLGVSHRKADAMFRRAGRNLKVALVMGAKGVSRPVAEELLRQVGGKLREILPRGGAPRPR